MVTSFNWMSLSPVELAQEAAGYRHDNDDGSDCFFNPERADWVLASIDPSDLGAFESIESARSWLEAEIDAFQRDGNARADLYETLLREWFRDPVVIGLSKNTMALWDGYHRTAIAMIRGEPLFAIVGQLRAPEASYEACHPPGPQ